MSQQRTKINSLDGLVALKVYRKKPTQPVQVAEEKHFVPKQLGNWWDVQESTYMVDRDAM